jgi:hypothetical protein
LGVILGVDIVGGGSLVRVWVIEGVKVGGRARLMRLGEPSKCLRYSRIERSRFGVQIAGGKVATSSYVTNASNVHRAALS